MVKSLLHDMVLFRKLPYEEANSVENAFPCKKKYHQEAICQFQFSCFFYNTENIIVFFDKIKFTFNKPFFAAASFALFVKSPKVLLPTYVKSSKVFLLTPAAVLLASNAVLDASCTDFVASSTAFFVCCVSCETISCHFIYRHKDENDRK